MVAYFPLPIAPDPSGLAAVGGQLGPELILEAYGKGLFPWMKDPDLLWFSPDPRMVLETDQVHCPPSLGRKMRQKGWGLTMDTAYLPVMEACARTPRPGQNGTWIDNEFIGAYGELHKQGYAHSLEVWWDGTLVGGLYGLALGRHFFGESMFHHKTDASKMALVTLCRQLKRWGFPRVDCQAHTPHLERMGARAIPRPDYLRDLATLIAGTARLGPWALDPDLAGGSPP